MKVVMLTSAGWDDSVVCVMYWCVSVGSYGGPRRGGYY